MVVVLPVSVGYTKLAGMAVRVAPIAAAQRVVVRKAALVVAREVAGSLYTPYITCYVFSPSRYNGNGQVP